MPLARCPRSARAFTLGRSYAMSRPLRTPQEPRLLRPITKPISEKAPQATFSNELTEAREQARVSRGCCTNEHILVPAGQAAREHQRCDGHCKLPGEYSHESFVSFAVDRRGRDAHLQAPRAHAGDAFGRSTRAHTQVKNEVSAPCRAPRWLARDRSGQGRKIITARMMISAHSGEKSRPAIGGMILRKGRSTGSHSAASSACIGE